MGFTEFQDSFNTSSHNIAPIYDAKSMATRAADLGVQMLDFSTIQYDIPPIESVTQYPDKFKNGADLAELPRSELSCIQLSASSGVYRDAMICKEGLAQFKQGLSIDPDMDMGEPEIKASQSSMTALADQFSIATLATEPGALRSAPAAEPDTVRTVAAAPILSPFGSR